MYTTVCFKFDFSFRQNIWRFCYVVPSLRNGGTGYQRAAYVQRALQIKASYSMTWTIVTSKLVPHTCFGAPPAFSVRASYLFWRSPGVQCARGAPHTSFGAPPAFSARASYMFWRFTGVQCARLIQVLVHPRCLVRAPHTCFGAPPAFSARARTSFPRVTRTKWLRI
jgi:hypothetical protein